MEAIASAKYLRGSAQKARLVVDMIRGQDVNKALAILRFSSKRASTLIEKCVRSAIANANEAAEKANVALPPDTLYGRMNESCDPALTYVRRTQVQYLAGAAIQIRTAGSVPELIAP